MINMGGKQVIVVVGPGRSGTSVVTRALNASLQALIWVAGE